MKTEVQRPARRRRGRAFLGLLLFSLALIAITGERQVLPRVAAFLDASDCRAPVDYVMVLAGHARTRPLAAAALYRAGWTDQVLVSAARPTVDEIDDVASPQHEVTLSVLKREGVPTEAQVLLHDRVDSTFDEAHTLRRFLADRPEATVAVLTNDYHVRRARLIFRRVLGRDASSAVCHIGAPQPELSDQDWWHTRFGFNTYLREYLKLAYYWLRYW